MINGENLSCFLINSLHEHSMQEVDIYQQKISYHECFFYFAFLTARFNMNKRPFDGAHD